MSHGRFSNIIHNGLTGKCLVVLYAGNTQYDMQMSKTRWKTHK